MSRALIKNSSKNNNRFKGQGNKISISDEISLDLNNTIQNEALSAQWHLVSQRRLLNKKLIKL